MFAFLPHGCGVANVLDFIGRMGTEPTYIAAGRGSDGFVEIAERILTVRAGATTAARVRED
jgi:hypothetical protein